MAAAPTTTPIKFYHFSTFTLDLTRRSLSNGGVACKLRPQSFDVLRYLIERHGQVVPAADIFAAVWKSPRVDPVDSLKQCVTNIRQALGEDGHWIVRTVSGVGYEFMPDVTSEVRVEADGTPVVVVVAEPTHEPVTATLPQRVPTHPRAWLLGGALALVAALVWLRPAAPPAPVTATLTMMATPNIAILPASGVSAATAPTIADDIAAELRRTPRGYDLTILPPATIGARDIAPDAVGRRFGVRYVVTTALRTDGDTHQVLMQLIEAPLGRQLWAAPFSSGASGLPAQTLLAARIAREIAVQIRTSEHARPLPAKLEAGHYTMQGRVLLESERDADVNARAMALFDKALALDPDHIQSLLGSARSRVAAVIGGAANDGADQKLLAEAEQAVARAIAIDKATVGAHLLRGSIERVKGNLDRAVASFEHARALNPNYAFAHAELGRTKLDMGKADECLAHIRDAIVLSPTDPVAANWHFWAGIAAAQLGDFKASLDWMLKARQINARNGSPRPWMAIAYVRLGEPAKAQGVIAEHIKAQPMFSIQRWRHLQARGDEAIDARLAPFAETLRELGVPERK